MSRENLLRGRNSGEDISSSSSSPALDVEQIAPGLRENLLFSSSSSSPALDLEQIVPGLGENLLFLFDRNNDVLGDDSENEFISGDGTESMPELELDTLEESCEEINQDRMNEGMWGEEDSDSGVSETVGELTDLSRRQGQLAVPSVGMLTETDGPWPVSIGFSEASYDSDGWEDVLDLDGVPTGVQVLEVCLTRSEAWVRYIDDEVEVVENDTRALVMVGNDRRWDPDLEQMVLLELARVARLTVIEYVWQVMRAEEVGYTNREWGVCGAEVGGGNNSAGLDGNMESCLNLELYQEGSEVEEIVTSEESSVIQSDDGSGILADVSQSSSDEQ